MDSGRDVLPASQALDLSRTVGYPALTRQLVLRREDAATPAEELESIRRQLDQIPNRGFGYDLFYWLGEDERTRERLPDFFPIPVLMNYLGTRDRSQASEPDLFQPAQEFPGNNRNLREVPAMLTYSWSFVAGDRLSVFWWYSDTLHESATIEKVADDFMAALRALIARCRPHRNQ
jgi:non-ribosomal peptide synthase protein (TIGR01720 family)